jgi:hypothetical protein
MFREVVYTQWRWSTLPVLLFTVAGFAIPLWAVQRAGLAAPLEADVVRMLDQVRGTGVLFPLLAALAGVTTGALTWTPDTRGGHVYALSLPVPRWYYVLMRFAAGLVLLAPLVLAVWIGGLIATAAATIPDGLYTYAGTIALRFALSLLVSYAAAFAIAAASRKTQTVIGGLILAVIGVQVVAVMAGVNLNPIRILMAVFDWPGPFQVFGGPWMLVDL